MGNVLQVRDLRTYFHTPEGVAKAVDGVSFDLEEGETLGVVGESGCGKSVMSFSILRLIPTPPGKIHGGEVLFRGQNLLKFSKKGIRKVRGKSIAMIFQEPMTALNPVFTVGDQILEMLSVHERALSKKEKKERVIEMLQAVGIPAPQKRFYSYPHQLSGGMRQRAMIAMALVCHPDVLIADEPTTALDVTIQSQILDLLKALQEKLNMSLLFITHDLGVIAQIAKRVVVMYLGRMVESGTVEEIFHHPSHPYTQALLRSLPRPGQRRKLQAIPGMVPSLFALPHGCAFADRCPYRESLCEKEIPPLRTNCFGGKVRCIKDF